MPKDPPPLYSAKPTTKNGRQSWDVTSGGERRTVVTSKSAFDRIKESAKKYDAALRRLADR